MIASSSASGIVARQLVDLHAVRMAKVNGEKPLLCCIKSSFSSALSMSIPHHLVSGGITR